MSETMTITERCSCGATFEVRCGYAHTGSEVAAIWRENHRHEFPPMLPTPPPLPNLDRTADFTGYPETAGLPTNGLLGFTTPAGQPLDEDEGRQRGSRSSGGRRRRDATTGRFIIPNQEDHDE